MSLNGGIKGLLYMPQVIYECPGGMILTGKNRRTEIEMSQYHFVHLKSHMD
jgi:hypothetical protein